MIQRAPTRHAQQMETRLPTTYTVAIAALARCGAWKEALELMTQAEKEGVEPSAATYHAAMFACTKGQPTAKWTECLDLLRAMKEKGLPVELTAYNTAILCAGMAHEVRERSRFGLGRGMIPSKPYCFLILPALHLFRQTEAAERLLGEMRAVGVKPDAGSYRGLIKSLAKSGDHEKCLTLLDVRMSHSHGQCVPGMAHSVAHN